MGEGPVRRSAAKQGQYQAGDHRRPDRRQLHPPHRGPLRSVLKAERLIQVEQAGQISSKLA